MAFSMGWHPFPMALDLLINEGLTALTEVFEDENAKDHVDDALQRIYAEKAKHEGENWRPVKKELLSLVVELLENGRE